MIIMQLFQEIQHDEKDAEIVFPQTEPSDDGMDKSSIGKSKSYYQVTEENGIAMLSFTRSDNKLSAYDNSAFQPNELNHSEKEESPPTPPPPYDQYD